MDIKSIFSVLTNEKEIVYTTINVTLYHRFNRIRLNLEVSDHGAINNQSAIVVVTPGHYLEAVNCVMKALL